MSVTAFPFFVTRATAASIVLCLPMIALSMVNFGMLSIWLNATLAILILIHHITFLAVSWVTRKRFSPRKIVIDDDDSYSFHEDVEPPAAYSNTNIAALVFLVILNALAFCIMVDITTRGGINSTLPAERVGSHKWNLKVEIGQTSVLGAELLILSSILAACTMGSRRLAEEKERKEAELECGMISPV